MKTFTIRDLERFSGIKAHTLRTWELRYGIPNPCRTEVNSRNYSLADLKELLGIAILNRNGYKISRLSALSPADIDARIQVLAGDDNRQLKAMASLLIHMYDFDILSFEAVLNDCFATMPLQAVLDDIIYPFLLKTKLFWQGNRLTEEHLVVTAIRKKIIFAIEQTHTPVTRERTVLLFLDGTRQLDLALLYTNYRLKNLGIRVIYLGNDISVTNLEALFEIHRPDLLYTYCSGKTNTYFEQLISLMSTHLPQARLIVSHPCGAAPASWLPGNVSIMDYPGALQLLSA